MKLEVGKFYNFNNIKLMYLGIDKHGDHIFYMYDDIAPSEAGEFIVSAEHLYMLKEWQEHEVPYCAQAAFEFRQMQQQIDELKAQVAEIKNNERGSQQILRIVQLALEKECHTLEQGNLELKRKYPDLFKV